jgi:hypothetical protein
MLLCIMFMGCGHPVIQSEGRTVAGRQSLRRGWHQHQHPCAAEEGMVQEIAEMLPIFVQRSNPRNLVGLAVRPLSASTASDVHNLYGRLCSLVRNYTKSLD